MFYNGFTCLGPWVGNPKAYTASLAYMTYHFVCIGSAQALPHSNSHFVRVIKILSKGTGEPFKQRKPLLSPARETMATATGSPYHIGMMNSS